MHVIFAAPSPFARKVRIVLEEKHLSYTAEVDVPWAPDTRIAAHNPLAKVPVLVLDDGRTLYDSRIIVEYLETLDTPPSLVPPPEQPDARLAVRQIEALADGICDAIVLIVLETARLPALQSKDWIARQQAKIDAGIGELARLAGDRTHIVGDTMTLADICAAVTLAYADLRLPDLAWRQRHPNLAALSQRMEARPSFRSTRPAPQPIATVT